MGNIANKLQALIQTKSEIRAAIQNKGVDVSDSDSFRSYANKINNIPQFQQEDAVRFFDYNGDILYRYTVDEISAMTSLPELPSHEGLTCQGWNWTLEDIKQVVSEYGRCDVGAIYISSDGKTRFYINISSRARMKFSLYFALYGSDSKVTIDWGDGTIESRTSHTAGSRMIHEYTTTGEYIVTLSVDEGGIELGYSGGTVSYTKEDYLSFGMITKAVLGSGIKEIHNNCFDSWINLSTINIPNDVLIDTYYTFNKCLSLKQLNIPSGITLLDSTFLNCYNLKTISLPTTIATMSNSTFRYCYSLSSVIIPNVQTIPNYTFSECYNLSQVVLGKNVTYIGNNAFEYTDSLYKLNLYNQLTSIGSYAFRSSAIKELTIPEGVTTINSYTFSGAYNLVRISLPSSLTNISSNAFENCISLSDIVIPDSVTNIGSNAFYYCKSLIKVTLSNALNSISEGMFYGCESLKKIVIPDSVTNIGGSAFYGCNSLSEIVIPDSVTNIGGSAFYGCSNVLEFKLPELKNIASQMFYGANGAGVIDLTKFGKIPSYGSNSLYNIANDCKVLVPNHLYDEWRITNGWIGYRSNITKGFSTSAIYSNTMDIDKNVFFGNSNYCTGNLECVVYGTHYYGDLETRTYKTGILEYIGQNKTSEPVSKEISVNYAGETFTTTITQEPYIENAILCTYNITSTEIATQLVHSYFSYYSTYFDSMIVDGEEQSISTSYKFKTLGEHSVVFKIKEGVSVAHLYQMFYNCTALKTVDLSALDMSSVTSTSSSGGTAYMFYGCSGLKSIILPESIKYLGNYMFRGCTNVELLIVKAKTAPTVYGSYTFGYSSDWMGYNNKGTNVLYVPNESTGYDTGSWTSYVCSSSYCGFNKKSPYIEQEYTNLTITAKDVSGKQTSTIINWTAVVNCLDTVTEEVIELTFTGMAVSESFPQNTSETETVQREITFTYMGLTATTTITQNIWSKSYYAVDLNDQWRLSSLTNPDTSLYEGVYESYSNYNVHNEVAKMYIDIDGYSEFKFYIRSNGEYYDYVRVGTLDKDPSSSRYTSTQGYSSSGTTINDYRLVTFSNIDGGAHRITIDYMKNSSSNSGTDRGYVLIPIEQ